MVLGLVCQCLFYFEGHFLVNLPSLLYLNHVLPSLVATPCVPAFTSFFPQCFLNLACFLLNFEYLSVLLGCSSGFDLRSPK